MVCVCVCVALSNNHIITDSIIYSALEMFFHNFANYIHCNKHLLLANGFIVFDLLAPTFTVINFTAHVFIYCSWF